MTDREKFIVLLDSENISKCDAIILLEGDGFARYKEAVSLYKDGIAPVIVFSGGFDDEKSGAYTFERVSPLILKEGVPEESLIHESKSLNTYEQAVQIIEIAKAKSWKRICLVASHYHTYRAFLTFLCEQKKSMPDLLIDIASVKDLDWYEDNIWGKRIDLLSGELDKIDLYQQKNNVASYEDGINYLKWKSEQI